MFRLLLFCAVVCFTQTGSVLSQEKVVRLWDGDAPGALGKQEEDTRTLTLYLPERAQASGAGMVICPGGGYGILLSTRVRVMRNGWPPTVLLAWYSSIDWEPMAIGTQSCGKTFPGRCAWHVTMQRSGG